jgi:hypothetical protein
LAPQYFQTKNTTNNFFLPVSYKSVSLSFRKKESWHEDFNHDNRDLRRAVRVTGCCSRIVHLQACQAETKGTQHKEHG